MSKFNLRLVQASDNLDDDFFNDQNVGNLLPDSYVVFFDDTEAATHFYRFITMLVINEHFDEPTPAPSFEAYRNASAFNGFGLSGTFVRFTTKNIVEVKNMLAALSGKSSVKVKNYLAALDREANEGSDGAAI